MSPDEFDPEIERLFNRTPVLPDASAFAAGVEAKLASGTRIRTLALTVAGLIGGTVAVRETLSVNLGLSAGEASSNAGSVSQGLQSAGAGAGDLVQAGLDQWGLAGLSVGSMGGMQLFWLTAAGLIALAAAAVMKLSQEI